MKKVLILYLILFGFNNLTAQTVLFKNEPPHSYGYHKHDGFYLSMCYGAVFGNILDEYNSTSMDMSGMGSLLDLKIGGAIRENLILHATIISQVIAGPTITIPGEGTAKAPSNFVASEVMFGVGLTYYVMPSNMFFSGTLGYGNFGIMDSENSGNDVTTEKGLSIQLKIGKEWWISKNWGLGVAFTYGKTMVTNTPNMGPVEQLESNRFGLLFNTTYN
jgi:hypothetical protein